MKKADMKEKNNDQKDPKTLNIKFYLYNQRLSQSFMNFKLTE